MNIKKRDLIVPQGALRIEIYNGEALIASEDVNNLVTDEGTEHIANQLSNSSVDSPVSYMAIGSGSGQTATDSTLATEEARIVLDTRYQGSEGYANRVYYEATFEQGVGTATITEAGLFNESTGGTMVCYTDTFDSINKTETVIVRIIWSLAFN